MLSLSVRPSTRQVLVEKSRDGSCKPQEPRAAEDRRRSNSIARAGGQVKKKWYRLQTMCCCRSLSRRRKGCRRIKLLGAPNARCRLFHLGVTLVWPSSKALVAPHATTHVLSRGSMAALLLMLLGIFYAAGVALLLVVDGTFYPPGALFSKLLAWNPSSRRRTLCNM